MTEHNATASVHVSLKDENGEVYKEQSISEDATLADVINLQDDSIWIEIPFDGTVSLQHVEFFRYGDDELCLGFHFDIDSLVIDPTVDPSAAGDEWQDTADRMEDALWEREEAMKAVLGCEDLAILWGGPSDTPKPKHGYEVVYYIDDCSAFLILTQRSPQAPLDLSMKLSALRTMAVSLDGIMTDLLERLEG